MELKRKIWPPLIIVVFVVGIFFPHPVTGEAAGTAGGQAEVKGGITFYSETSTTETSTTTSSTDTSTTSSTDDKTPGGKLPNTGETVRNYGIVGVGILGLLLFFLVLRKKRKENGHNES